jgi:hypothetical protein
MNSGFDPMIVAPSLFRRQTASQQAPFHFGGSQVPLHLGMKGRGMKGGRMMMTQPIELSIEKRQQIEDMISETIDLLNEELDDMIRPDATVPNINNKIRRFPAVRNRIQEVLQGNPTERVGEKIIDYLNDYTQSPIQPYRAPNF